MSINLEQTEVSCKHSIANFYWRICLFLVKVYSYAEKIIWLFSIAQSDSILILSAICWFIYTEFYEFDQLLSQESD